MECAGIPLWARFKGWAQAANHGGPQSAQALARCGALTPMARWVELNTVKLLAEVGPPPHLPLQPQSCRRQCQQLLRTGLRSGSTLLKSEVSLTLALSLNP